MAFVDWKPEWSVKVAEIDAQHKKLFDLINAYYDGIKAGKADDAVGKAIDGLLDYTKYHFTHEEKLMQKYGYPALATQQAEHKLFIDKIADFKKRLVEKKLLMPIEVSNYLKSWLTGHILQQDMKYSEHFNKAGLT